MKPSAIFATLSSLFFFLSFPAAADSLWVERDSDYNRARARAQRHDWDRRHHGWDRRYYNPSRRPVVIYAPPPYYPAPGYYSAPPGYYSAPGYYNTQPYYSEPAVTINLPRVVIPIR